MRIEKVGRNRNRTAVISGRRLCLSEEEIIASPSGGKVIFLRLEIIFETTIVAEVNIEKVGGCIEKPHAVTLWVVRPWDISDFHPTPRLVYRPYS